MATKHPCGCPTPALHATAIGATTDAATATTAAAAAPATAAHQPLGAAVEAVSRHHQPRRHGTRVALGVLPVPCRVCLLVCGRWGGGWSHRCAQDRACCGQVRWGGARPRGAARARGAGATLAQHPPVWFGTYTRTHIHTHLHLQHRGLAAGLPGGYSRDAAVERHDACVPYTRTRQAIRQSHEHEVCADVSWALVHSLSC